MAVFPVGPDQSIASLHSDWRRWLRARHGSLAQSHEDIVQQTSADLLEWMGQREAPIELAELGRVGFRVLQRRAVDAYRDHVRRWANEPLFPLGEDVHSPDLGPEESVEYAQLLKAVIELLSNLPASDRELILRDELFAGAETATALTQAERKRLSRLRKELRNQLFHKHRIDMKDT